jgi:hypothetical protein
MSSLSQISSPGFIAPPHAVRIVDSDDTVRSHTPQPSPGEKVTFSVAVSDLRDEAYHIGAEIIDDEVGKPILLRP